MPALWMISVAALLASASADTTEKGDREKLQGTWNMVAGERNGAPAPPALVEQFHMTFAGDKVTVVSGKRTREGKLRLATAGETKTFDILFEGKTIKGIYKFRGEELIICYGEPDTARPTEFASPAGSANFLMILKKRS